MIIRSYIQKEIFKHTAAVTAILLFIALANRLSSYLAKAVKGLIPMTWVGQLLLLYVPDLIVFILPIGFYFGAVFALSRLYADQEMVVLETNGFSPLFFIKILLISGLFFSAITGAFSFWLAPKAAHFRASQLAKGEILSIFQSLTPGRFHFFPGNKDLIFYIQDQTKKQEPKQILIIQPKEAGHFLLLSAQTAQIKQQDSNHFHLTLHNGLRYEGNPQEGQFSIARFAEYGRHIEHAQDLEEPQGLKSKPTFELLKESHHETKMELQWRFGLTISPLCLGYLAFLLSRSSPREGRFARFLPTTIAYLGYYNLMLAGRHFCTQNPNVPLAIGMHLAPWSVLCCALIQKIKYFLSHAHSR